MRSAAAGAGRFKGGKDFHSSEIERMLDAFMLPNEITIELAFQLDLTLRIEKPAVDIFPDCHIKSRIGDIAIREDMPP